MEELMLYRLQDGRLGVLLAHRATVGTDGRPLGVKREAPVEGQSTAPVGAGPNRQGPATLPAHRHAR
jgi:hypothetical protein